MRFPVMCPTKPPSVRIQLRESRISDHDALQPLELATLKALEPASLMLSPTVRSLSEVALLRSGTKPCCRPATKTRLPGENASCVLRQFLAHDDRAL